MLDVLLIVCFPLDVLMIRWCSDRAREQYRRTLGSVGHFTFLFFCLFCFRARQTHEPILCEYAGFSREQGLSRLTGMAGKSREGLNRKALGLCRGGSG